MTTTFIVLNALMICAVIGLLFCVYMGKRNDIVCRYRLHVLHHSSDDIQIRSDNYKKLPSYNKMFWQLFAFNWDKYWKDDV